MKYIMRPVMLRNYWSINTTRMELINIVGLRPKMSNFILLQLVNNGTIEKNFGLFLSVININLGSTHRMSTTLQPKKADIDLMNEQNIKNASALLALLHGKSDSICRLFKKEILVSKNELSSLNDSMISKLSLHNISAITTSIDITFSNKRILTFKSWVEFESYDFKSINSATKSIFIQWDFLALISNYEVPQRHTVSVRISSNPNPSDFFKVLLSGGFDESHDLDIQSCIMICKVDFVNNTLAEELVNVAEHWNELCECAYSKKGVVRPFLYIHRTGWAHIFEVWFTFCIALIIAIALKILIQNNLLMISNESLLYALVAVIPLSALVENIAHAGAKKIYNSFGDLMDIHIFSISTGDSKEQEKIEKNSRFGKEVFLFALNAIFSIVLSIIFFAIE